MEGCSQGHWLGSYRSRLQVGYLSIQSTFTAYVLVASLLTQIRTPESPSIQASADFPVKPGCPATSLPSVRRLLGPTPSGSLRQPNPAYFVSLRSSLPTSDQGPSSSIRTCSIILCFLSSYSTYQWSFQTSKALQLHPLSTPPNSWP